MIDESDTSLLDSTAIHEGFRSEMYICPAGRLSIGYGYNLEAGMSEREARALMILKYEEIFTGLTRHAWWESLSDGRQRALAEMAYQLGAAGLLRFQRMLSAIEAGDFDSAADEMLDSQWAEQTPSRARHCADLMRAG